MIDHTAYVDSILIDSCPSAARSAKAFSVDISTDVDLKSNTSLNTAGDTMYRHCKARCTMAQLKHSPRFRSLQNYI
jgi:hypothetical protein